MFLGRQNFITDLVFKTLTYPNAYPSGLASHPISSVSVSTVPSLPIYLPSLTSNLKALLHTTGVPVFPGHFFTQKPFYSTLVNDVTPHSPLNNGK